MPAFARGQTHLTAASFVEVDGLPAGRYRFALVVDDNGARQSLPAEVVVEVVAPTPTPTVTTKPWLRTVLDPVVRSPIVTRLIR